MEASPNSDLGKTAAGVDRPIGEDSNRIVVKVAG